MLAVEIATSCNQAISMNEIALMLPSKQEPQDVQAIIQTDLHLSKFVSVENNLAVLRGQEHLFSERVRRTEVSREFQKIARSFASALRSQSTDVELVAVCGSAAYESAADSDDIDLFIVSKPNRMWLTFLRALLLARVFKFKSSISGEKVDFCLSYVQDRIHFEREIEMHRTPLFAREFLSLHVMTGNDLYAMLLNKAKWMKDVFPNLYARRLEGKHSTKSSDDASKSAIYDAANMVVYAFLKSYLSFKAFLRNSELRKKRRNNDLFEAIMTKGSSVYNSERYREIENKYCSETYGMNKVCFALNQGKS